MRYKVLIHGSNLMLPKDEQVARMGFYATRLIAAPNAGDAMRASLAALLKEEDVRACVNPESSPPQFVVEEVEEIGWFGGRIGSWRGFTFYEPEDLDDVEPTAADDETPRQTAYRIEIEAGGWRKLSARGPEVKS